MAKGGKQPGAGRPKGAVNKEKKEVADIIEKYGGLEERIERLRELSNGILVKETGKDGEAKVYLKAPDTQANIYLIDRVCGKPKQAVDMKVEGQVTWELMFGVESSDTEGKE